MTYISSAERLGIEKGIKQGLEQSKQKIAKKLIQHGIKLSVINKATGLSMAKLREIEEKVKPIINAGKH